MSFRSRTVPRTASLDHGQPLLAPRTVLRDGGAWELTRATHARLGPEGRLRAAFEASEFVRSIAREGIQARHPGYDDLQLDRALFRQIYGLNESPPHRVDTRNLAPAVTLPPGTLVRA